MKLPVALQKYQKVITYLGGALVAWLLYTYAITPYRLAITKTNAQLKAQTDSLRKERDAVATAKLNPMLQQMTDSAMHAIEPKLFDGVDDAVVTSDLQAYLHQLAYENKVNVMQSSTRPANALTNGVRALHVDLRAQSDFQGVLAFLKALERGDKLVTVERIDITKQSSGGTGALAAPEDIETVSVNAVITGYAMGELSTAQKLKTAPTTGKSNTPALPGGK